MEFSSRKILLAVVFGGNSCCVEWIDKWDRIISLLFLDDGREKAPLLLWCVRYHRLVLAFRRKLVLYSTEFKTKVCMGCSAFWRRLFWTVCVFVWNFSWVLLMRWQWRLDEIGINQYCFTPRNPVAPSATSQQWFVPVRLKPAHPFSNCTPQKKISFLSIP